MRILMLTTSYPLYRGETTAPFIEEIAAALVARGHTIHLVAPWHPELQRAPVERGVHLHFYHYAPHPNLNIWGYAQALHADTYLKAEALGVAPLALLASMRALQQVIAQQQEAGLPPFDLVQAHWVLPNAAPTVPLARLNRLPLIVSLHGNDIYLAERFWPVTPVAGLTLRAATAITACSNDLRTRAVQLGAPPLRSTVIPYGINIAEFRPDADARATLRNELEIAEGTPLVVGLGRLVYKKGFGVLLDAWHTVLTHEPRALLVLVGYGDLREQLEHQAWQLGVAHRVRFVGQAERRRAAAFLAAADVFALPIVRDHGTDGLPNVLLEAMGAGRAIVASQIAGVPDVLEHETHGLLVPDRDPDALAVAILRLFNDRALAARLGAAARHRIETELTWDDTAARFEQVYLQAVEH